MIETKYTLCLDIGGTKVLGALFDENDRVISRVKKKTLEFGREEESISRLIMSVSDDLCMEAGIETNRLSAIAAGVPGSVDPEKGTVIYTPNLPLRNYRLGERIEKLFGVPFFLGNDASFGVLGELSFGAARGSLNCVGLFVGTGVGGGIVIDGRLYNGSHFLGGEIGHMKVAADGPKCGCGQRGCLEAFSSKTAMSRYIREQGRKGRKSLLLPYAENGVFKSKKLLKALENGDRVAIEAVEEAAHYLAVASGSIINIFAPDMVVFGGGVMEAAGDIFMKLILKEAADYAMPEIMKNVRLEKAALGDDSVIYGALAATKLHDD